METEKQGRSRGGFTLAESLFVILLLAMVTGTIVTGTLFASRQYTRSMQLSQSKILCSTLMHAIGGELSNVRAVRLGADNQVQYFKSWNFNDAAHSSEEKGLLSESGKITINGGPLVSDGAYPRGLSAEIGAITYLPAQRAFRVNLIIKSRERSELINTEFDVICLNQITTLD